MRILYTIIFCFIILICCKTQKGISILDLNSSKFDLGKCYYSMIDSSSFSRSIKRDTSFQRFILEISPAKFKTTKKKLKLSELKKYDYDEIYYMIQTRKEYSECILTVKDFENWLPLYNKIGYMYCISDELPLFLPIKKSEVENDHIEVEFYELIEESQLILKNVKKRPNTLKHNQYYFEGRYWTTILNVQAVKY